MFVKKEVVVIPETPANAETYGKIYQSLTDGSFRDFLRIQISELACALPDLISNGKERDVQLMAGEIKAYKYLLNDAPVIIESQLRKKEQSVSSNIGRFSSVPSDTEGGENE